METGGYFLNLKNIMNVLISSFCFICIPILWAYGHYKYITFSVWGSTLDVRIWRLQMSDYEVYSLQIMTTKAGPRDEKVNIVFFFRRVAN